MGHTNSSSSSSSSDWANLVESLMFLILDKLFESIHHVCFAAVCKEWCVVSKKYHQATQRGLQQTLPPMLMIPITSKPDKKLKLYSVSEQKLYNNIALSAPSYNYDTCNYRGQGWWVKRKHIASSTTENILMFTSSLVNPFTKAAIRLPSFPPCHSLNGEMTKIILSADPILNPDNYVVLKIYTTYLNPDVHLAFTKAGQRSWTCYTVKDVWFKDAVFYKGQVYAIGNRGAIFSFELDLGLDSFSDLESTNGELLHVQRFLDVCYPEGYNAYESDCSGEEEEEEEEEEIGPYRPEGYYSSFEVEVEEVEEEELNTETFMVDIKKPLEKKEVAPPLGCKADKEYILESTKGELLHIRRFFEDSSLGFNSIGYKSDEDDSPSEEYSSTEEDCSEEEEEKEREFMVYKVVFDEKDGSIVQHVEIKSIGDEAIFIDEHNHSFSILASTIPGCKPNCIYYTVNKYWIENIYIFNLKDGTVERQYKHDFELNSFWKSRDMATWVVPPVPFNDSTSFLYTCIDTIT